MVRNWWSFRKRYQKVVTEGTEEITTNTYVSLHTNASIALSEATKVIDGRFFKTMTSIIFSAFTIEAYANHILKDISKKWEEVERYSSLEKVYELYNILEIDLDKSKRPIQSIQRIFNFRNMLAHGKTTTVIKKFKLKKDIQDLSSEDLLGHAKPEWEELNTLKNAKVFFEDMEKVIKLLHEEIASNINPFLVRSVSSGDIKKS